MATGPESRALEGLRRQRLRPTMPSSLLLLPILLLFSLADDSRLSLAFAAPSAPPSSSSFGRLWRIMVCIHDPEPTARQQQQPQRKIDALLFSSTPLPPQSRSSPSSSRLFAGVEPDEPVPFSSRQMSAVRALEVGGWMHRTAHRHTQ